MVKNLEKYKQLYLKRIKEETEDDAEIKEIRETLEKKIRAETAGVKKFGEIGFGECDCEFCRRVHGDYIYSGLLTHKPKVIDRIGHYAAFIIDKETQIMGAGLEILQDFGIIVKDKVYRHGYQTVCDGRTFNKYNPYYTGIKLLDVNDKEIVIGLRRATDELDIYIFNLKSYRFEKVGVVDLGR